MPPETASSFPARNAEVSLILFSTAKSMAFLPILVSASGSMPHPTSHSAMRRHIRSFSSNSSSLFSRM